MKTLLAEQRGQDGLGQSSVVLVIVCSSASDFNKGRGPIKQRTAVILILMLKDHFPDSHWMNLALDQARLAASAGEVPVGAVLVHNNELIAAAFNAPLGSCDPTAHAEVQCLRKAASARQNYRLADCDLFVTLEPCSMCAGALVHARVRRLVYGASEPRAGAVASRIRLLDAPWLNHRVEVVSGVLADECSAVLQDFFRARREA